jgi:hypothetical protein
LTYRITKRIVTFASYVVNADSPEEAMRLVQDPEQRRADVQNGETVRFQQYDPDTDT